MFSGNWCKHISGAFFHGYLDEECVEFDKRIQVQYISSKSFGIGEIAFWEGANYRVYVVENQNGEDMVRLPYFDETTSVEDIFDMLMKLALHLSVMQIKAGREIMHLTIWSVLRELVFSVTLIRLTIIFMMPI